MAGTVWEYCLRIDEDESVPVGTDECGNEHDDRSKIRSEIQNVDQRSARV